MTLCSLAEEYPAFEELATCRHILEGRTLVTHTLCIRPICLLYNYNKCSLLLLFFNVLNSTKQPLNYLQINRYVIHSQRNYYFGS